MSELFRKGRTVHEAPAGFEPRTWQDQCLELFARRAGSHSEGKFCFIVSAGVGSGKTGLAALLACHALNNRLAERIVYVCPNRAIVERVQREFRKFNIELARWRNRSHATCGEGVGFDGAVITYQSLASRPHAQAEIAHKRPTLVIFDEIHHLGDRLDWGQSAERAFEHPSTLVVGLTGTPYRSDNRAMPFVKYASEGADGLRRFQADYTYSLGRSVADRVCKQPMFRWLGGDVEVTVDGVAHRHDFHNPPPEEMANVFLSGAVRPGSGSRLDALRIATAACFSEGRKLIIFVGGDSTADDLATEDAESILPRELESIGINRADIVSITSENKRAVESLEKFGASNARVLITVNMVSEGVDIPELSAALFLTSITATATTVQRIGRTLRAAEEFAESRVFMFRDPRYMRLAEEIEREIQHEISIRPERPQQERPEGWAPRRRRIESCGLCAYEDGVTVNGVTYSQEQVDLATSDLKARRLPPTSAHLHTALAYMFGTLTEAH